MPDFVYYIVVTFGVIIWLFLGAATIMLFMGAAKMRRRATYVAPVQQSDLHTPVYETQN